jgi:hypothetical protein
VYPKRLKCPPVLVAQRIIGKRVEGVFGRCAFFLPGVAGEQSRVGPSEI